MLTHISKPTLPWTVLDSTGQLPQSPSYSQQGTQLASTVQTIPAPVPAVPDCPSSTYQQHSYYLYLKLFNHLIHGNVHLNQFILIQ